MNLFYLYVFIRKDLSLAQQMVQACHASAEAGQFGYRQEHGIAHLVLLEVPDQRALLRADAYLERHNISREMFFEPDNNIGESAICTHPVASENKSLFRHWPLWRCPV